MNKPEAYITLERNSIYFNYSYFLQPIGWASDILEQQQDCQKFLEKTLTALQKEFGGKQKKRPTKMYYAIDDHKKLVLTGPAPSATGLFGVDLSADSFVHTSFLVNKIFKQLGWSVEDIDDLAIRKY